MGNNKQIISSSSTPSQLWDVFCERFLDLNDVGIRIDTSRMCYADNFFSNSAPLIERALKDMVSLEGGEISNPDEGRMVGHYWLRTPELSPTDEIRTSIVRGLDELSVFSEKVISGQITGAGGNKFKNVLVIGIGGSALGPQLVADSLGSANDKIRTLFCDNTDPDGIERLKTELGEQLSGTLCIVISKSGGTVETRNGMREFEAFYKSKGLDFSRHAIAVTCEGSALHAYASESGWISSFFLWDWVGGRTSLFSPVGLLPAALQGFSISEFLEGARAMDQHTRGHDVNKNPALIMAMMWFHATGGAGKKDMVILPYKDRLVLFSKYLQQLIMESLGKELDLDGKVVHQGISVYGNKGSTDQHAYVQQLRDGVNNFFAIFIEVLEDYTTASGSNGNSYTEVDSGGITSGAYLNGFFQGTRTALFENGRESITLTLERLDAKSLGALIALFERTVSFYGSFVNVNPYHQPGVEAGKKAAVKIIDLRRKISALSIEASPVNVIAEKIGEPDNSEAVYKILEHMAFNQSNNVKRTGGSHPLKARYSINKI
ncbi:MAG TPA: glucose-6-phosphate isomerase [Oligoflexia bacterium]|nr:glucose-6-phosphate isomerase [Oligoflexia bacterium]HMP47443.1 glucose-6-phosphate isomerase [Oligoflexia bacterium]